MLEINQPLIDTTQSKWRNLRDLTLWEKIFLFLALLTIVDEIILSIVKVTTDSTWRTDVLISIVVFVNVAFCIIYAVEGIVTTRPSQLLVLSCSLLFLTVLLFGNYITGHHDTIKLVQMILAAAGTTALLGPGLYYAWSYKQQKRLVTLTVGDSDLQQAFCLYLMTCRDLLLSQVQTGASLIILASCYNLNTEDKVFISIGFPYLVAWSVIGYYAMKKESVGGSRLFFLLCIFSLGFVVYAVIFVARNMDELPGIAFALILSTIAFFVVVVSVFICAMKLYMRFGAGFAARIN